jgi:hypothetical protein
LRRFAVSRATPREASHFSIVTESIPVTTVPQAAPAIEVNLAGAAVLVVSGMHATAHLAAVSRATVSRINPTATTDRSVSWSDIA